jgi:putative Holliday junction resolvase
MTSDAGPNRRLLGVDVGERRIGVAVSEGRIAVPLTIIKHTNRANDVAQLVEIARREGVAAIVVGLPISLSGEEHEQARLTRNVGDALAQASDVPVVYHDERYSSVNATIASEPPASKPGRERRGSTRRKNQPVDDRAAAVILQSYIDAIEEGAV